MTTKRKDALLFSVLSAVCVSGCGIVLDCNPRHVFGTVLVVAAIVFLAGVE